MPDRSRSLLMGLVGAVTLALPPGTSALERVSRPSPDDATREFRGGSTCAIAYYNSCTGWAWLWDGWQPGDRFGTQFDACGPLMIVRDSWIHVWHGAPAGYGFTGAIRVFGADANQCPTGAPLQSQPFLPASGWNTYYWSIVPPMRFVVLVELGLSPGNPIQVTTDHPAAGPTGPTACGICYPIARVTHSFAWGPASAPRCPGSPFFDGVCNAELFLDVNRFAVTAIEPSSWGTIKALYR